MIGKVGLMASTICEMVASSFEMASTDLRMVSTLWRLVATSFEMASTDLRMVSTF